MVTRSNYRSCSGDDDCPICKLKRSFYAPKTKYAVNVLDRSDNKMKIMMLSKEQYNDLMELTTKTSFLKNIWLLIKKFYRKICLNYKNCNNYEVINYNLHP